MALTPPIPDEDTAGQLGCNPTLENRAAAIRSSIITMLAAARSGHSAGALGMADILAALYFKVMKHRPAEPDWSQRDALFLSNGHTAPVLYAALAEAGYFPKDELTTLRQFGSRLQGHPERTLLPGLESTSGPLGSGLSQGAGFAYMLQHIRHERHRFVYVLMGDGELQEGNIWEAAMFAAKYRLAQLVGIVDRNYIQIDGPTESVMPLGDLAAKWESFGWHTVEINGNDVNAVVTALEGAKAVADRPSMIIAHTIPGRGVPFMEYDYRWHGKPPSPAEAELVLPSLLEQSRPVGEN